MNNSERTDHFFKTVLPEIGKRYKLLFIGKARCRIDTGEKGIIDYYPKSGNLFIHQTNKKIKSNGLKWINKHLFKNMSINLGQKIKQARTDMGMTQQELADKTGIRQDMICRYEKGQVGRLQKVEKIFEVLEIEVR